VAFLAATLGAPFLSFFYGGGCWPIVILYMSLNLAGKGGGFYCFTTIYSGRAGNYALKVFIIKGILN
jgi:hypothetical protein